MTRAAVEAAQRRDCADVDRIGRMVHAVDAGYYEKSFRTNRVIQTCLAQPPSQTRRYVPPPRKKKDKPGETGARAGGYMLGIGVLTFGVSALLVDAAEGFVIGLTVGAILVALGLIVLFVSALIAVGNS